MTAAERNAQAVRDAAQDRFKPVKLPEGRGLNGRGSQTLLRHYAACPRSGFLYQSFRGGSSSREMQRGKALHLIHERQVRLMLEHGEVIAPPEIVKTLADEVLAEMHVPFEEHDYVREMAFRLATEVAIDPSAVVAAETLFVVDVPVECARCSGGGEACHPENTEATALEDWRAPILCPDCGGKGTVMFEVRCRIDFAELVEQGAVVHVEDYKSAKSAVTWEEISRKRPDGSPAAKALQLVLYAVALVYGVPVREETCEQCEGTGKFYSREAIAAEGGDDPDCFACEGKGRYEVREPFPVASRAQRLDLEYVYPGIEDREGKMLRRMVTLTRMELEAYRASLAGIVGRLLESERTGDWPAVVSDAACSECPASALCPIPVELRDHRGEINTPEECAEALEVQAREKKVAAAKSKEIRAFVKQHGPVRFGGDMVAEIGFTESTRIADKEAMFEAQDRAVKYGEVFERHRYVKSVESFPLVTRALSAEEINSEGSNDGQEERVGGGDVDPGDDARG